MRTPCQVHLECFTSWRTGWTGHVVSMGEQRKAHSVLVRKPQEMKPARRRWVDDIEMALGEI